MASVVVPAQSGDVVLDTFTLSEEEAHLGNLRALINGHADMAVNPGEYARLRRNGSLWMTDTPAERLSNLDFLYAARGDVLVLGLGIAMLPTAMHAKEGVSSITVVEIDPDVIAALAPTLARAAPSVRVVEGDAFLPERSDLHPHSFDVIVADIWPSISPEDYPEHIAVRRAWRKWLRPGGAHLTWQEQYVKRAHHEERCWMEPSARERATKLLRERRMS